VNPAESFVQEPFLDFTNDRPVAGCRAHLRDAGAHEPTAEYAYGFDGHI
jgi:hypothetical protein